jgi:transcriptional regulator with XRE-family HTH domain
MDYESLSSELLRALRGRRSQAAFSRRLGYKSNVAYAWESGRAWPTAANFLRAAERVGVDSRTAFERFYRARPEWLTRSESTPASREGVSAFLRDLAAARSIQDMARAAGASRFVVSRWLSGATEPRLPDFLRMIEVTSLRLLDFVACFANPKELPSVARDFGELESARLLAYEHPFSHAVLRVLELEDYQRLPRHRPGFIAERLGIDREAEQRYLGLLLESGQIRRVRGRYRLARVRTVDTRDQPELSRKLRAFWAKVGVERLEAGVPGTYSYNLFSVSRADLERIRALHRNYFRELRAIVAASQPAECVALAIVNLVDLTEPAAAPA